jgi:hypothetical protein
MEIKLEELRDLCDLLIQHIIDNGDKSVNLKVDYYWHIPTSQMYDPYKKPTELNLGQLSFDWNQLIKIYQSQKEPIGYNLVWLAAILRAVGENITG